MLGVGHRVQHPIAPQLVHEAAEQVIRGVPLVGRSADEKYRSVEALVGDGAVDVPIEVQGAADPRVLQRSLDGRSPAE